MRLRRYLCLVLLCAVTCCTLFSASASAANLEQWQCGDYLVPPIPEKVSNEGQVYAYYLFAWGDEGQLGLSYKLADTLTLKENGRIVSSSINSYVCKKDGESLLADYYMGYWSIQVDIFTEGRVILWSSVDVYNADGSLYMAGSDPEITYVVTPVVPSDIESVVNAYSEQLTVPLLVGILAGAAGVSIGLVFIWWGVRKVKATLIKAFKSGKLRI